jgi:uncharacterized protein YcaQ
MMASTTVYPLAAVRALALHTQGLTSGAHEKAVPTPDQIYNVVERLGCVQIDTLQMVRRSHYLVLWSRLGKYNPSDLDWLVYSPNERRLFEGWQHAASIVPLIEYRYQMPHQRRLRENPSKWLLHWLTQPGNQGLIEHVLERIRQEGAMRAADFEYEGPKREGWWDWKPAKVALEHQYAYGALMIANRENFQRIYDLTERVLPNWVDQTEPTLEERDRYWLERSVRALGVCQPAQAAEYAWMKRGLAQSHLEALRSDGVLIRVRACLMDGLEHTLAIHRDNLPLLEQAADGAIVPRRTTFLSPFDSLFWAKDRDDQFWGFRQVLEAYKPSTQRVWGYFCLPILYKDRLVGRFDPRLDRKTGTLRLNALYLEPGVILDEELVHDIAVAMHDFLAFHEANDLVVERSQPEEFGAKLLAAL